jgi:ArsR family transcriptional regulator
MNAVNAIDREAAVTYASWFRSLGDATRVQILNLLARSREPLRVGEIVAALEVGQSTVSQHLKVLAEVGFVLVEHRGTASLYRVNESCISCFPSAADLVMGRLPARAEAPWNAA